MRSSRADLIKILKDEVRVERHQYKCGFVVAAASSANKFSANSAKCWKIFAQILNFNDHS